MLNAKEARELLVNSEAAINKQLEKIDTEVRKACSIGENRIEFNFPGDGFCSPVVKELQKLGYHSSQLHSRGIEIKW